ncbi:tRNA pseudouridine synthase A [Clostridiales bacterium]|nr:tRNA pseudouridine synthase A [Clostridiales bacterium]
MKKNIAATVQYDGTRYRGWQKQGNTKDTIQGKLEHILSVLAGEEISVNGSGRTDAGVHAAGQQINFHIDTELSPNEIMDYINEYLPTDIGVIKAWEASPKFHSRLSAVKKIYSYRIHTDKIPCVLNSRYEWQYNRQLNIKAMEEAASYLFGTHDFQSFTDLKKTKKSTVRTIESIDISVDEYGICIDITGDSFLYHMVRIIVGTLIEVGEGKREPSDIPRILKERSRREAGVLAPPCGLMLMKVFYH